MDVILVRFLIRKAKKLARKWGGQCIIFIDEIDAVGMRRNALGGSPMGAGRAAKYVSEFYGPMGSFLTALFSSESGALGDDRALAILGVWEKDGQDVLASGAAGGAAAVDLYWLPLGAGGHFVRLNGRAYEALVARMERRAVCDLYHSALQVRVPEGTFVVEQAPVSDLSGKRRGVVAEGAVGSHWAGRFRIFRYEIRLWPNGHIPDVVEAVDSP